MNLPASISKLTFGEQFKCTVDDLPNSITSLAFEDRWCFKLPVDHLPPSLTSLEFAPSSNFDHPLNNLPNALTSLKLGHLFNHSMDHLPPSLTLLEFGNAFDQPVDNLPSRLRHLRLGLQFNHSLDHLPAKLRSLMVLSSRFNIPIKSLPPRLMRLTFDERTPFNHPLNLTSTIKRLSLSKEYVHPLPALALHHLAIRNNIIPVPLPSSLASLKLTGRFNQPLPDLPPSLHSLILGHRFNQPLDNLPPNLTHIEFRKCFNHSINQLPSSVTFIKFALTSVFSQPITSLPPTLTYLELGCQFKPDILFPSFLPSSLVYLKLFLHSPSPFFSIPPHIKTMVFLYQPDNCGICIETTLETWKRKAKFHHFIQRK